MAQGAYIAPGSVKEVKSCYVGAGGVKTVSAIYIGQGGSVKKVWPAYTDYGGDDVTLSSSLTICADAYGRCNENASTAGADITGSYILGYTNKSGGNRAGVCRTNVSASMSFSSSANIHWYSIGPMDTRGYNYMRIGLNCGNFGSTNASYYGIPVFGYNSNLNNNPYYGGNYVRGSTVSFGSSPSSSGYNTSTLYFLFDFTNINLESTYLQFGLQIGISGDSAYYSTVGAGTVTMHKSKPSGSVSQTLTY